MLFYRLILLSWVIYGLFLKVGSIKSPEVQSSLQATGKNENENFLRPLRPRYRHLRFRSALSKHPQYDSLTQTGKRKSLMTQVLASSMRHHGDHPRKFIDFLDNGAQWHHFISKPRGHNKELRINEGNFHVNLKYGNHDLQEQDDRRYRNTDSMYVGDTISGENSLSKFTAPPVYDEESANYQRKTKLDLNYEADTPEAVATEKQNTEQFVNRLHALMPPLATPYDFHKGRGKAATNKMIQEGKHAEKIFDQDEGDFGHQGYLRQIDPENGKTTGKKYADMITYNNKPSKTIDIAAVEDISKFEKDPSMYDNQEIDLKSEDETRNVRKEENDEADPSNNDVTEKDATYRPHNGWGKNENEIQSEMETGEEERGQPEETSKRHHVKNVRTSERQDNY